jgi:hypothetical protein
MGAREFETVLARLYVDAPFRRRFLIAPEAALAEADLSEKEKAAFLRIDRAGLLLAAGSYARKRADHSRPRQAGSAIPKPARSRLSASILSANLRALWSGMLTRLPRR